MSPWVPEDHTATGSWAQGPRVRGPRELGGGDRVQGQIRHPAAQGPGELVGRGQGSTSFCVCLLPAFRAGWGGGWEVGETRGAGRWWRTELQRTVSKLSWGSLHQGGGVRSVVQTLTPPPPTEKARHPLQGAAKIRREGSWCQGAICLSHSPLRVW